MKNIRHNVFETNSSSSHSISISSNDPPEFDTIYPDKDGKIILTGGEFGWEYENYFDSLTKANYCAIDCKNDSVMEQMLIEVIKEHTGASEVILKIDTDWNSGNYSYIDHQSQGTSHDAFESKETLRRFIFDRNSVLTTDNDNH